MMKLYFRQTIALMVITMLTALVAGAQSTTHKAFPPGPCHQNLKQCVTKMQSQLNTVRAYLERLKPGDTVAFNPQPDPPGDPNPWYRRAREAFGLLKEEIADLSQYPPSERKVRAINKAQETLGRLAQASDRESANAALNAMKPCIKELSR